MILEQAFETHINFNSITEKELVRILQQLKLVRPDNPKETMTWLHFYSKIKVDESNDDKIENPIFDIRFITIALYFLTSGKPESKAKYIASMYFQYGVPEKNERIKKETKQSNNMKL